MSDINSTDYKDQRWTYLRKEALFVLLLAASLCLALPSMAQPSTTQPTKTEQPSAPKSDYHQRISTACSGANREKRVVCRMSASAIAKREQEIITREWRTMPSALVRLKDARLMRPSSGVDQPNHGGDRPYQEFCEGLRQDLLKGRYHLLRRPDVSTTRDGTEKVVKWLVEAEKECEPADSTHKTFRRSQHVLKWLDSEDTVWLVKTSNGISRLSFDFAAESLVDFSLSFGYDFDACRHTGQLPTEPWNQKPPPDTRYYLPDTTDYNWTRAFGVIERKRGELVALEYFSVHGWGDQDYRNGYGSVYEPTPVWVPAPAPSKQSVAAPGKARNKKPHKNKEEEGVSYFLGAFIAPPPWKRLYEEEAHEDVASQQRIEPCVWQLND